MKQNIFPQQTHFIGVLLPEDLTLTLEDTIKKYEIFSVYVEYEDFDYYNLNFKNDSEWFNHITKLKNKYGGQKFLNKLNKKYKYLLL